MPFIAVQVLAIAWPAWSKKKKERSSSATSHPTSQPTNQLNKTKQDQTRPSENKQNETKTNQRPRQTKPNEQNETKTNQRPSQTKLASCSDSPSFCHGQDLHSSRCSGGHEGYRSSQAAWEPLSKADVAAYWGLEGNLAGDVRPDVPGNISRSRPLGLP